MITTGDLLGLAEWLDDYSMDEQLGNLVQKYNKQFWSNEQSSSHVGEGTPKAGAMLAV